MNEAKRYLRYIVPGTVAACEALLLLAIAGHVLLTTVVKELRSQDGLGLLIGAVLATGAVGYLLGMAHHTLSWLPWIGSRYGVDYRPTLEVARRAGRLQLILADRVAGSDLAITHYGSWTIISAIWHRDRLRSKALEGADPRTESLTDLMHGSGASFVGSVVAFVICAVFGGELCPPSTAMIRALLIGALLLAFHFVAYRGVRRHCEGYISSVFATHLYSRLFYSKSPVRLIIQECDVARGAGIVAGKTTGQ